MNLLAAFSLASFQKFRLGLGSAPIDADCVVAQLRNYATISGRRNPCRFCASRKCLIVSPATRAPLTKKAGKKEGAIKKVLAAHYGFTDEELDFPSSKLRTGIPSTSLRACNYDINYRMGRDAESDEEI